MHAKLIFANICCLSAFSMMFLIAQGNLTPPPGPPAPTMKTLAQIEPRVDILTLAGDADSEHVLSNPGSYYLSGNLSVFKTDGLRVTAADVHIDLNGFQIVRGFGTGGGKAISLEVGAGGFSAHSGSIRGFADAIAPKSSPPTNLRVRDLTVSQCDNGISLGSYLSTMATRCSVYDIASRGIQAGIISECIAAECGGLALDALIVSNSRGQSTGSSSGIDAFTVENSQGVSDSGAGLSVRIARGSLGGSTSGTGIASRIASGSQGSSSTGIGISTAVADGSEGTSVGDEGIDSRVAIGSVGFSTSDFGIDSRVTGFSTGNSSTNTAIVSSVCVGSHGRSASNDGIGGSVVGFSRGDSDDDGSGISQSEGITFGSWGSASSNDASDAGIRNSFGVSAYSLAFITGATVNAVRSEISVACEANKSTATFDAPKKFLGTP